MKVRNFKVWDDKWKNLLTLEHVLREEIEVPLYHVCGLLETTYGFQVHFYKIINNQKRFTEIKYFSKAHYYVK